MLEGLRIAFIAGTLGQGGAERQLYYIVKTLKEQGAHPRVLCLTRGEFWENKIQQLGVQVIWVGQSPFWVIRLYRIIKELLYCPVDIVQSHHFFTNLYVVIAARLLGLYEIGAIRNNCLSEVLANGKLVGRLNLLMPRRIAANSRKGMQNAIKIGVSADRLFFLPNMVDVKYFQPFKRQRKSHIHLLSVGRLVPQKRIDRFLAILASVRSTSEIPVTGIVVGEGPLHPALEQQANDLGLLPEGVEFLGQISNMQSIYHEADVLVLTSEWEGTPNVVLEAMACGLPVVASKVGDVPFIINNGVSGFIVDNHKIEEYSDKLKLLIHDHVLRFEMGKQARRDIEKYYEPSQLLFHLKSLYQFVFDWK